MSNDPWLIPIGEMFFSSPPLCDGWFDFMCLEYPINERKTFDEFITLFRSLLFSGDFPFEILTFLWLDFFLRLLLSSQSYSYGKKCITN